MFVSIQRTRRQELKGHYQAATLLTVTAAMTLSLFVWMKSTKSMKNIVICLSRISCLVITMPVKVWHLLDNPLRKPSKLCRDVVLAASPC